MQQLLKDYDGKIRYVVKNYPYKYRDHSFLTAQAFRAAFAQGKGWELQEIMLGNAAKRDHAAGFDRESLIEHARRLGLDVARFTADLDGEKYKADVDQDIALAQGMNLYNTPTFYINGRRVVGKRSYEFLKNIIEEELQHAKQK